MSKFSIDIKQYSDIPFELKVKWLSSKQDDESLYSLFIDVLRHHKVPVKKMSTEHLAQLYNIVDWAFLNNPPLEPIIKAYKSYLFGEAKMKMATALEFQMADYYFNQYIKTKDDKYLTYLFHTVARKKATKDEYIRKEDIRSPLKSKTHIESTADAEGPLPKYVLEATVMYTYANLTHIGSTYSKVLGGGDGESDGLGWTSTFMSIAESRVFGNLEQVYDENIYNLFTYMLKKKRENEAMEKKMKSRK